MRHTVRIQPAAGGNGIHTLSSARKVRWGQMWRLCGVAGRCASCCDQSAHIHKQGSPVWTWWMCRRSLESRVAWCKCLLHFPADRAGQPRSWRCKIVSRMQLWTEMKGWKLFVHLAPENVVVSFRLARSGKVPKNQVLGLNKFANRQWLDLLGKSQEVFAIQKETDLGGHSGEEVNSLMRWSGSWKSRLLAAREKGEGYPLALGNQDIFACPQRREQTTPMPPDPGLPVEAGPSTSALSPPTPSSRGVRGGSPGGLYFSTRHKRKQLSWVCDLKVDF